MKRKFLYVIMFCFVQISLGQTTTKMIFHNALTSSSILSMIREKTATTNIDDNNQDNFISCYLVSIKSNNKPRLKHPKTNNLIHLDDKNSIIRNKDIFQKSFKFINSNLIRQLSYDHVVQEKLSVPIDNHMASINSKKCNILRQEMKSFSTNRNYTTDIFVSAIDNGLYYRIPVNASTNNTKLLKTN